MTNMSQYLIGESLAAFLKKMRGVKWILTEHARERMELRGISREGLAAAIRTPQMVAVSQTKRDRRILWSGGISLVVECPDQGPWEIVTVFPEPRPEVHDRVAIERQRGRREWLRYQKDVEDALAVLEKSATEVGAS